MSLAPGSRLGPYEITAKLGEGGMGEVYRAHDPKLGRDVALKVLPAALGADPERVSRFRREAQLVAALNHPNIAAIYGLEEADGAAALVLELVEGEDLAQRLTRGPVPVDEAIAIARQIAEALEAAHERGIVHRDLKPQNVKLATGGSVKVLDFGLAKALDPAGTASGSPSTSPTLMNSPTLTAAGTQLGVILGTAAYMAPEQARGRQVDRRADIWAFGVVVHEMLTGRRLFAGDTVSDTLAAVLRHEIDFDTLPASTPAALRRLLARCLDRDPKTRLRDIGEARVALSAPLGEPAALVASSGAAPWRRPALLGALALCAAAAAALGVWIAPRFHAAAPATVTRLSIALPPGQVLAGNGGPAISRDGRTLAYVARDVAGVSRLYARPLDRFAAGLLPESEGAQQPFFSPDGSRIGFFARGKLLTASLAGGAPTVLADASFQPFGATWGEDDTIVFVPALNSGLLAVSAAGGNPRQLTAPDDAAAGYAHVWPQFLPGGRSLLFTIWGGAQVEARGAAVLSLASGKWTHVATGLESSRYARSGHLLQSEPRGVMAAAFDPGHPQEVRSLTFVVDDVFRTAAASNSWFATSDTGTLIYVPGDPYLSTLAWVDLQGHATPLADQPTPYADPALSPDGTRVALEDKNGNLWVEDLRRGTLGRLTLDHEGSNAYPTWSHDGRRVLFGSNRGGDWDIYEATVGGGPARRVLARKGNQFPMSEAPDGTLLFVERTPSAAVDLWTLAPDGSVKPLAVSPAGKVAAQFSPDGRLIAYASDETGRDEIYVRTVAPPGDVVAVSTGGGLAPRWSPDGKEVYYRRGDAFLAASVTVAGSTGAPTIGDSRQLFEVRAASGRSTMHAGYAVAPDGKRFLVQILDPRAIPTQIDVVLNWFAELAAKVPSR